MQAKDIFPVLDKAWTAFTASVTDNTDTAKRLAGLTEGSFSRPAPFKERAAAQQKSLKLPVLPTTTIGSFPQVRRTESCRKKRLDVFMIGVTPSLRPRIVAPTRQKYFKRDFFQNDRSNKTTLAWVTKQKEVPQWPCSQATFAAVP